MSRQLRTWKASCAALAGITLAGAPSPAFAGSIFPAANGIVFSPLDANTMALRTTYGILLSSDRGTHWQFLCLDAVGLPGQDPFPPFSLAISASGGLVAGTSLGLSFSADTGCTWACQASPLANEAIVDLAVRLNAPHQIVALALNYSSTDGGAGIPDAQLFETGNDGASWAPIGTTLPSDIAPRSIGVSRSDPSRIYVSATRGYDATRTAWLLVSSDGGVHWTEKPIAAFDPLQEQQVVLGAVDPSNADVVYLRSEAAVPNGEVRLFVSGDAGNHFSVPNEVTFELTDGSVGGNNSDVWLSVALSTDGSKVYVGTRKSGLWVASAQNLAFRQINPCIDVQCLATRPAVRGDELWACSGAYYGGFVAGVSTDDGATFTPRLSNVYDLSGQIACDPKRPVTVACGASADVSGCDNSWTSICLNALGGKCPQAPGSTGVAVLCPQDDVPPTRGPGTDGSVGPGGPGDNGTATSPDAGPSGPELVTARCGCSTPGGKAPGAVGFAWLVGIFAWSRRRESTAAKARRRTRKLRGAANP